MDVEPLLTAGPFTVTAYSLAAAAGCLISVCLYLLLARRYGPDRDTAERTALFAIPLGIFAGHFLYALVKLRSFLEDEGILFLLTPWRGGFMFLGTLLGVCLATFLGARDREGVKKSLNCLAPALTFLIAVMRFIEPLCGQGNGEDTEIAFFPLSYAADPEWPQFRSAAIFFWAGLYGIVCCLILLMYIRKNPEGLRTAKLGLVLYCAGEILLESLRRDQVIKWSFVRVSQLFCAIILVLPVIWAVIKGRYKGKKAVLSILAMAVLIGGCVALEFSVDKPLILGDNVIYFTDWLTYGLLGLCGALMGTIAWRSVRD